MLHGPQVHEHLRAALGVQAVAFLECWNGQLSALGLQLELTEWHPSTQIGCLTLHARQSNDYTWDQLVDDRLKRTLTSGA